MYQESFEKFYNSYLGKGGIFGSSRKQRQPTEDDDSGYSSSKAYAIELYSEGVVEGLIKDAKSIYLDETPVQNAGGSYNFTGFRYRKRQGRQNQSSIPGFDTPQSEIGVFSECEPSIPQTRRIINNQIDQIRVRVAVRMVRQKSNGDVKGSSIDFRILIKQGSDPYEERLVQTISGKYSDLKEFEYQFEVDNQNGAVDEFNVRVERISPDTGDSNHVKLLQWQAFTGVISAKLTYPNSALVALEFSAEQFNSVPQRAFQVGGIIVRIPTVCTVRADRSLNFTPGFWDGSFYNPGVAVNDPVWILYECLTNTRWGLGNVIDASKINLGQLYWISKYCNERVDDGFGGKEARYSFTTQFTSKAKAFEVIDSICSSAKIKYYYSNGMINFWQDSRSYGNYTKIFTRSDIEGDFVYSSTAIRTIKTVCYVAYNDPDNFYKQRVEPVEDKVGISKYGVIETETTAVGCVSRGQAIRFGRDHCITSRTQKETLTFTARNLYAYVRPGDIIKIQDENRANIRYGGLIKSALEGQVTLDYPVYILPQSQLTVTLPDGTIQSVFISNAVGTTTDLITLASNFSEIPNSESNWIITSPYIDAPDYRVLDVAFSDNDPTKVEIIAIEHIEGKYDEIEKGIQIPEPPTRLSYNPVTKEPVGLNAEFISTVEKGITEHALVCSWSAPLDQFGRPDPFITSYLVEYKEDIDGVFEDTRQTTNTTYTYRNLPFGDYVFRVAALDINNQPSRWVSSDAIQIDEYHPDSIKYRNRLNAFGISISKEDLDAVNQFVIKCYSVGLRTPDFRNSIIRECVPFAGDTINAVKLWGFNGENDTDAQLYNFSANPVVNEWTREYGLDPGSNLALNRVLDTGINPGTTFSNGIDEGHLAYFSTKDLNPGTGQAEMGACFSTTNNNDRFSLNVRWTDLRMYFDAYNLTTSRLNQTTPGTSKGFFIASRRADRMNLSQNGNLFWGQFNTASGVLPQTTITVFGVNGSGGNLFSQQTIRPCGFYSFGDIFLPELLHVEYYAAVKELMTGLGRNMTSLP